MSATDLVAYILFVSVASGFIHTYLKDRSNILPAGIAHIDGDSDYHRKSTQILTETEDVC
ncbi:hypothetical protein BS47DRAFT_1343370 [Hydnum rufescens UP504]|uniref:Uncharacterized protein n=1 Tax=Hydnum rufescens UP504 TaxID=1448309 RepID=A0A9P6B0Q8_9AGAM|nr:hypothetical protein BS47DRAFT_1343370 [Hydnum rufescens UP504]